MFHSLQMHNESRKGKFRFGRFRRLLFHICRSGFRPYRVFVELALAEWGGASTLKMDSPPATDKYFCAIDH